LLSLLIGLVIVASTARANTTPATLHTKGLTQAIGTDAEAPDPKEDPDRPSDQAEQPSDAERVASLEHTIDSEEKRFKELEAELASPTSEYARAEKGFLELDRELQDAREKIEQLKQQGKTREAALLERSVEPAETQWKLAKTRFELAIDERKTLREEIGTLKQKIQKDRKELAELTGENEAETAEDHSGNSSADKADPAAESADSVTTSTSESADSAPASEESDEPPDEDLMHAQADAKEKEKEAKEAQEEAQEIESRVADLLKIIAQQQKGLTLARKKADLALETQRALELDLAKKQAERAPADEIQELTRGIADAKLRYTQAHRAVTEISDRLNDNRSELSSLQQQQILALQAAREKRLEAETAKETVQALTNPFAPRNILKWLIDHGPRVTIYFVAMIVLLQSAKVFSQRIVQFMAAGVGRGTTAERENRAKTLVGVFQNAASVTIIIGGTLIILDEMGAKVGVLLGGVAVAGLAVAFGAQNLIKDYFYGFVMLLENQYMLHDVVKIGDLTGQVERITLRMTVLRDANGVVHFIPNGQINCVSNETHGWSRAAFDIGIAYKEDVDHCIAVLTELALQMRQDPIYGPMIIDDPTVPAVDQLADSSVVLKFFIKTRPHQQSAVRRELLRRIKNRFDQLGIELPYPQRTIYHRYEEKIAARDELVQARKCA
jgi:small conductance mechanosensitive channel